MRRTIYEMISFISNKKYDFTEQNDFLKLANTEQNKTTF